ncbi:MAG: c-type cytochrome [Chitinophagaceae bacterium]
MKFVRKFHVLVVVIFLILAGSTAIALPGRKQYKNLKVLSKNISRDDLETIMNGFQDELGVKCNFCHTTFKNSSSDSLDFVSDEKPEKEITRRMMRMTTKINNKYFSEYKNVNSDGNSVKAIRCITCHHGKSQAGEKR